MECLPYAEPDQSAMEAAVGHRVETFAFIELTLLHKAMSSWTVNTAVRATASCSCEKRTGHLTRSS